MADLRSRLPVYAPLTLVLVIAAVGMARVLTQHWREGAALLGGALLVAAVLRVLLPVDRVGLLAIRSRAVDVLCYAGLGVVMAVLAATITRNPLTPL
jgi:multisubunit Na+/H+ antiporter MnhB subunit